MDDRAVQELKEVRHLLEELRSISNLLERQVASQERLEQMMRQVLEAYAQPRGGQ